VAPFALRRALYLQKSPRIQIRTDASGKTKTKREQSRVIHSTSVATTPSPRTEGRGLGISDTRAGELGRETRILRKQLREGELTSAVVGPKPSF
jgi:hypothetical protein